MTLTRWGFESGANNDTVTAANAGADAAVVTSGSAVISTSRAIEGTRSALMTAAATSGTTYITKNITATSQLGLDVFVNITALPSAESPILWIGGTGSARMFSVAIATDGKVRLRDGGTSGGANAWTSASSLSLNTWYRVSVYATQDAASGTIRVAYFAGNATTPVEDSTLMTAKNTGASQYITFRIGPKTSTGTSTMTAYFDNYGYDTEATNLLPVSGAAPVARATASNAMSFIDATASTGVDITYTLAQTAGPTQTPVVIGEGRWLIPMDSTQNTVWNVTVTQSDDQTDTKEVTVLPAASGSTQQVEMLYATGPGTFV